MSQSDASSAAGRLSQADLDDLLREVLARVEGVLDEKERLRLLLDAVVTMAADLTLDGVLARIVAIAGALVDARYAALGVLGGGRGDRLRTFIHHGISADSAAQIGELPTGHGLLGLIIDRPEPLRLHDIADHPESYGFPPDHPRMRSFLGVPVRIRGRVFGNLYLTEKAGGADFTTQDEEIVVALAAAAGVVIENARLYEETQRREQWLAVTAEITVQITGSLDYHEALQTVVDRAREVAASDAGWIVSSDAGELDVRVASGSSDQVPGWAAEAVLGSTGPVAIESPEPSTEGDWGAMIAVPLGSGLMGRALVLALGWASARQHAFHEVDVALPESFAKQAGFALEVSQARETSLRLAVLEDRDRIGRDLHDLVIQRLFAVCLGLEGTSRRTSDGDAAQRMSAAVDDLDATIKDIRRTIFALGTVGATADIQSEVTSMVDRARSTLKFRPTLSFEGPVRTLVGPEVAQDVLAVLGEAISNASRHAGATALDIVLAVRDEIVLTVTDNGRGVPAGVVESGMGNMRHRAHLRRGSFQVGVGPEGGTRLVWSVPIGPAQD
ncbi:two-component system sensor histidine kinase [soil metagenome]